MLFKILNFNIEISVIENGTLPCSINIKGEQKHNNSEWR